ncbi:MAG: hypothetical protein ACF8GE_00150 [Phycisphaerales bacterium JB043]
MTPQEHTLPPEIWASVRKALSHAGIDLDETCEDGCFAELTCACEGDERDSTPRVRMVCVSPHLRESVEQVAQTTRDNVVMVRVDEPTLQLLDAWVQTGAVRSRSEAAAVFIREGLGVRQTELEQLREALDEVERAKARLSAKVSEVFGDAGTPSS